MTRKTVEVDKRYLWALETLVCDNVMEYDAETEEWQKAIEIIIGANLNRPNDYMD